MFPWKSVISLDKSFNTPIYLQITNAIVKLIGKGNLQKGAKLPGSRQLSELLGINRKTVIQAYDELIAQGWLIVSASKGTFVTQQLPVLQTKPLEAPDEKVPASQLTIQKHNFIPSFKAKPPALLEINDGSPDHRLAPVDWIYKECRSLAKSKYGKNLLKYSDILGDATLREQLVKYLAETRGMMLSEENVLITRGSQMGIYLLMSILLQPHDLVVVGETSYDAADWTIHYHGGKLTRIPVDEHGLDINALEKLCQLQPVKLIYVTSHHHYPTTVTLSNERRIKLLELSFQYNFVVIEDDYDYDFHYSSSPILPLASLNHRGYVAYVGSFSKIFAPSIRVGYVAASAEIINQLSKARRIMDRQGDQIMERVIAESIITGELQRHLKKVRQTYFSRRELFCQLLQDSLQEKISFRKPDGGMAVWCNFHQQTRIADCFPQFQEKGLYLNVDKSYTKTLNSLRLGFASLNEDEIKSGLSIFSEVVQNL